MKKTLLLIRGLPGSGKTTIAEILADSDHPIYGEDDHYINVEGKYEWSENREVLAKSLCLRQTVDAMRRGDRKVFVTNVFATEDSMQLYCDQAGKYDYRVVTLLIENRHGNKSIHNVRPNHFELMRKSFQIQLT